MNLGNVYSILGKFENAIEFYESAIKIQDNHYGKNHIETAKTLGSLGNIYSNLGNLDKAKEFYEITL